MRSSLLRMRSSLVRMRSSLTRMRSSLMQMRSSLVVWASDCQCTSCNGPGFDPSIRPHSGIWGAADEAMLNIVWTKRKKSPQKIFKKKNFLIVSTPSKMTSPFLSLIAETSVFAGLKSKSVKLTWTPQRLYGNSIRFEFCGFTIPLIYNERTIDNSVWSYNYCNLNL